MSNFTNFFPVGAQGDPGTNYVPPPSPLPGDPGANLKGDTGAQGGSGSIGFEAGGRLPEYGGYITQGQQGNSIERAVSAITPIFAGFRFTRDGKIEMLDNDENYILSPVRPWWSLAVVDPVAFDFGDDYQIRATQVSNQVGDIIISTRELNRITTSWSAITAVVYYEMELLSGEYGSAAVTIAIKASSGGSVYESTFFMRARRL